MNMSPFGWFITLVAAGFLLTLAEVFLPGGVAGVLGGLMLLAAMGVGLATFPGPWGFVAVLAIMVFGGIAFLLWVQFFPRSRVGRRITLQTDSTAVKTVAASRDLMGATGETVTALRPAGVAIIGNQRYDVLAEGGTWIPAGAQVKITAIRDGRLVVSEATENA